jgi:RNase H-like domain found in reverse transcriptase/Reverse transcriptase (RNA-dependent DNA polymerase)/Integrase zinc binding domain/Integrase core domain
VANGHIRKSESEWRAPITIAPKRASDGTMSDLRFCVNYRRLNAVTRDDAYPIESLENILHNMRGAKVFTRIDLTSAYWQMRMNSADRHKTAFSALSDLWEWNVLPFGLKTAVASFQRFIDSVLEGIRGEYAAGYVDDIIIYSKDIKSHLAHVKEVVRRLNKRGAKIKLSKCEWAVLSIAFLGHIIADGSLKMDPSKIVAMRASLPPTNVKELQRFLGMTGFYRRFIQDYSKIVAPLTVLLRNDKDWVWGKEQDSAFIQLKEALVSSNILRQPDFLKPFVLETDASDLALGAVLTQRQEPLLGEKRGRYHPILFISRKLTSPEQKWCTREKEALAIFWSVTKLRYYLWGRHFTVLTDHGSLKWLLDASKPRLWRWVEQLSEFQFTVVYRKGELNRVADYLSRTDFNSEDKSISNCCNAHVNEDADEEVDDFEPERGSMERKALTADHSLFDLSADISNSQPSAEQVAEDEAELKRMLIPSESSLPDGATISPFAFGARSEWKSAYLADSEYGAFYKWKTGGRVDAGFQAKQTARFHSMEKYYTIENDLLYWQRNVGGKKLILVPLTFRDKIYIIYHALPMSGHLGVHKTLGRITNTFHWHSMRKDISTRIRECLTCRVTKTNSFTKHHGLATVKELVTEPFRVMYVDHVGPLPVTTRGNKYIFTMMCAATHWIEAVPVPDCTAATAAYQLWNQAICRHGCPSTIVSDRGAAFTSALFASLTKYTGIKHNKLPAYHPQANLVEKSTPCN